MGQIADDAAEWDRQDAVYLVVAELAYGSKQQHGPLGCRQLPERGDDLILKMFHERAWIIQHDGKGIVWTVLRGRAGNVFQRLPERRGFPFAVAVEEFKGDEPEYPRPEIGPFGVAVKASERLHDRTLENVLHMRRIAEHTPAIDFQRPLQWKQKLHESHALVVRTTQRPSPFGFQP